MRIELCAFRYYSLGYLARAPTKWKGEFTQTLKTVYPKVEQGTRRVGTKKKDVYKHIRYLTKQEQKERKIDDDWT